MENNKDWEEVEKDLFENDEFIEEWLEVDEDWDDEFETNDFFDDEEVI
jgi:hypothetical protein